jgi:hypothetical protein
VVVGNPAFTIASLATSSSLVAGRESGSVDNSTNLYVDVAVRVRTRAGSSPSAGTIELWGIPSFDGTNWPNVFDGTDSAETVTSRDILSGSGRLLASTPTDTTSSRDYELNCPSLADVFGSLPLMWSYFITHNTGVNLDSTGANHLMYQVATYDTVI